MAVLMDEHGDFVVPDEPSRHYVDMPVQCRFSEARVRADRRQMKEIRSEIERLGGLGPAIVKSGLSRRHLAAIYKGTWKPSVETAQRYLRALGDA